MSVRPEPVAHFIRTQTGYGQLAYPGNPQYGQLSENTLKEKSLNVNVPNGVLPRFTETPVNILPDPITNAESTEPKPWEAKRINYGLQDRVLLSLKRTFVDLPKAVYEGLTGKETFSFGKFMQTANIPYYMGGAVLSLCFLAGASKMIPPHLRALMSIGLYYAGQATGKAAVNAMYKQRYAMDLNAQYQLPNGEINRIFDSSDFPNLAMLTDEEVDKIAQKLKVPDTIQDKRGAVDQELRHLIDEARNLKMVLGTTLAAVGAGFLARSDAWAHVFLGKSKGLRNIWNREYHAPILKKLEQTASAISSNIEPALAHRLHPLEGGSGSAFVAKWAALLTVFGVSAFTMYKVFIKSRHYQFQPTPTTLTQSSPLSTQVDRAATLRKEQQGVSNGYLPELVPALPVTFQSQVKPNLNGETLS